MEQRERIIHELLGQSVHVEVDRPIGCVHHGDIIYPVNYGYIPGVMAGDGEEQDAYILGVSEPLRSFDGPSVGQTTTRTSWWWPPRGFCSIRGKSRRRSSSRSSILRAPSIPCSGNPAA